MEIHFIRNRVTELRLKKGVSEVKMSRDLGHSDSYITQITSGRSNPSVQELLYIIDYLGVAPEAFFAEDQRGEPILLRKVGEEARDLSESDLLLLLSFINRLKNGK